jgi:hypothetical protein
MTGQADTEVKLFSQIRCIRTAAPPAGKQHAPRVININAITALPTRRSGLLVKPGRFRLPRPKMELGGGILVNSV